MSDLLAIENLSAGYGEATVLSGVSLSVPQGQALALLGRNGMGKTTLINTIVGATRYRGGRIMLDGRDIARLRSDQRAGAGAQLAGTVRRRQRELEAVRNSLQAIVNGDARHVFPSG